MTILDLLYNWKPNLELFLFNPKSCNIIIFTLADWPAEELEKEVIVEDEEPAVNDSGIMTHVDEIRKYNNPNDFVAFAKATVAKYINVEPAETIEAFKSICNEHYATILKK